MGKSESLLSIVVENGGIINNIIDNEENEKYKESINFKS